MDALGMRLGRYEIRERIGRGGMATVYKGRDTTLEREVAVKILHEHLSDDPDFKQRFEREAKLVATLQHPNIVQVYDFAEIEIPNKNGGANSVYLMVMPLIMGPTLRSVLDSQRVVNEPLPLSQIAVVMEAVCKALAYAHSRGMVHRDVTPANILYTAADQEQVVLADFGLARLVQGTHLTQTGMTTGTPIYMSPEQGMGEQSDGRGDIYALGVILYEMLTGNPPFSGDSAYSIIMQHVTAPVPVEPLNNERIPSKVMAVVQRALAKNREDRYPDATAFLADFKRATADATQTALRTGLGTVLLPTAAVTAPMHTPRRLREHAAIYLIGGLTTFLVLIGLLLVTRPVSAPDRGTVIDSTPALLPTRKLPGGQAMTDAAMPFADDFSNGKRSAWQLDVNKDDPKISRTFVDNALRVRNTYLNLALPTVIDTRSAYYSRPIVIEAEMSLSPLSQAPSATGIIFRYQSDDEYYVFAFDGNRRVSIWALKAGNWRELRNLPNGERWTVNDAVNPLGSSNRLRLIAQEDDLIGYINDKEVVRVKSGTESTSGGVGVYLATTASKQESSPLAIVDVVRYSVQPFTPNVTPIAVPTVASAGN